MVISQKGQRVILRALAWLALVIPAVTVAAPLPQPNFQVLIPALFLLAIPLALPSKMAILKLFITIPLTMMLIFAGSQLPSTIVVIGFVLAEIAVRHKTREVVWTTAISVLSVGTASVIVGDSDSLRPLWLVHAIGIGMFVALGIAIRERIALVAETQRSLEATETAHQVQLAEAITQERLNISRELHNRLGHQLTVISLNTEVAKQSKAISKDLRENLEVIGESARQSLGEISTYLESLRDGSEDMEQSQLLEFKFDKFRRLGLEIDSQVSVLPRTDNEEFIAFLDQALDELFINALKYGNGSVNYQQQLDSNSLVITLVNQFDANKEAPSGGGFGLKDITERAAHLGAEFGYEQLKDDFFKVELRVQGWC